MMDRRDVQAFLKGVSTVVRESLASVSETLVRLEARIETVAAVQPLKGDPGESIKGDAGASAFEIARSAGFPGTIEEWLMSLRGKDAPAVDMDSIVLRAAELAPKPKDAPPVDEDVIAARVLLQIPKPENGKDAPPVDVDSIVIRVAELVPRPENGKDADESAILIKLGEQLRAELDKWPRPKDGERGQDAPPVDTAALADEVFSRIRAPQDGRDADMDQLRQFIEESVARAVSGLPVPQNGQRGERGEAGESIHPDTVALMVRAAVDQLPRPEPGKPGEPGKSALEVEVRTGIDPEKSYPAGTIATYQGGTIRAARNTDPVTDGLQNAGWQVLLDGIADEKFIQSEDFRSLEFARTYTSGRTAAGTMNTPFMQHVGYWKAGEYLRSQCVTQNGSTWYCVVDQTTEKPGEGSTHWLLIARKGSDGKDFREPAPKNGTVNFK